MNCGHKKPDTKSGSFIAIESGGDKVGGVGHARVTALQVAQGVAYHLFGQAGTFTALAGNPEGVAYVAIAAAAIVNGFTYLTVGNTFTEADVHIRPIAEESTVVVDANANENACQRPERDFCCQLPIADKWSVRLSFPQQRQAAKKRWAMLKIGVYDDRPWNCAPSLAAVWIIQPARAKP